MSLNNIIQKITQFRDDRNWKKFHNPKDLSLALSIEAAELNETFLWKQPEQANPLKIKEELADVFIYAFLMADAMGLNVEEIIDHKLNQNAEKYPIEKSKDSSRKYNEF
jgi:NTP pyrophosphatase (non-canonical NTP hydrolase)